MNEICVLENITKKYKKNIVLKNISLRLEKGKIYGFIGKNGAGKTTTMRIIAGLSLPTYGDIYLDGEKDEKHLKACRKKMGCMIEMPALYHNMSAENNLKAIQILYGNTDINKVQTLLDIVGLENTGRKKVKNFSLGMKQRLGIAMALVNDPTFLILDEPINGLDPSGIVEIRDLIKKINQDLEVTILISSHILSELYRTVDRYILINKGEIVEELTQTEIDQKCEKYILIKDQDHEKVKKIVRQRLQTEKFTIDSYNTIRLYGCAEHIMETMKTLVEAGIEENQISVMEESLEEYFMKNYG